MQEFRFQNYAHRILHKKTMYMLSPLPLLENHWVDLFSRALLLHMGPEKLLLASIVAMSIFPYMLHRADSEEVFPEPEADGPAAENSSDDIDELWLSPGPPPRVVDVDDYGARAAGADDSEAFLAAWREACNATDYPGMFLVPEGRTYHLMPVSFHGPCRAISITAMIRGKLEAPSNRSVWLDHNLQEWITFEGIDRLHVQGGGTLNGNGQQWWINSCKVNKSMRCVTGPTALYFRRCTHLVVEDLEVRDSMQMHVAVAYSWNVLVSKLFITAPGWSPNTDGIHVSNSKEVSISECIISTGDDCIAIVTGSMFVRVTGIFCGPGHGISIGSLGANNSWAHVSDVLVEKATLLGTTNGVRIKTWQGGHGYAERITFQDIAMHNVTNPVLIQLLAYVIYATETYAELALQKWPSILFAVKLFIAMV
ncbi:hypothetical protein ACP70R_013715 [Stipagrostis hirtigluma subsp. patula]